MLFCCGRRVGCRIAGGFADLPATGRPDGAVGPGSRGVGGIRSAPEWLSYRHDAAGSGIDPDSPAAAAVTPTQAWQTPQLDGAVYGQPLVYGSAVFVATENDTIYKLDSSTGAVIWSTHLATPQPSSAAQCGNITPNVGITSTPVIDPTTNRIYAVGAVTQADGTFHHEMFAVDLTTGQEASGFPVSVDPPTLPNVDAVNQLQRTGLTLTDGRILIGYGGNSGDCATYWGWLVSAPESGQGEIDRVPGQRRVRARTGRDLGRRQRPNGRRRGQRVPRHRERLHRQHGNRSAVR